MQQAISNRERKLLQQLRAGESVAVRKWFALHHDPLLRFVLTKVSNKQDAEEIVQEVFINSLRQINLFQENSSLQTWMIAIARHEIADYYRKRYAKSALRALPISDMFGESISVVVEDMESGAIVSFVMIQLSELHRELLLLKYVDRRTVSDIAKIFGKTVKSVESELFRARTAFKNEWLQASNQ